MKILLVKNVSYFVYLGSADTGTRDTHAESINHSVRNLPLNLPMLVRTPLFVRFHGNVSFQLFESHKY
jgi:hypothetical protein